MDITKQINIFRQELLDLEIQFEEQDQFSANINQDTLIFCCYLPTYSCYLVLEEYNDSFIFSVGSSDELYAAWITISKCKQILISKINTFFILLEKNIEPLDILIEYFEEVEKDNWVISHF